MRRATALLAFCGLLLFAVTAGCDSAGSSEFEGEGSLELLLTDAPFPYEHVDEANVTISRVEIVRGAVEDTTASGAPEDESAVVTLVDSTQQYNLLELQDGVTALLAEAELEAGTYEQLRLIVDDASVLLNDGRTFDLKVPSGAQTGIKVLLPGFDVQAGENEELTLDFKLEDSFIVQGNPNTAAGINGFIFKPVIKPLGFSGEEE